jgi:3-hydroxyisobutyrate dehydrogenase-like beta-hydroxyacid dehydrogenase
VNEQPLGIIGLGLLGNTLAERVLAAGYVLAGYDIDADRCSEFASLGGSLATSVSAVAKQCRQILLSLPDSKIASEVIAELTPHLSPGMLLIDTTTGDPADSKLAAAELANHDVDYVDATIVGSSAQVRAGDCIVLMGGSPPALQAAEKLCSTFAQRIFHVGPSGSGAQMKLVVNLVLGLNRAVLAEGLCLAESLELDPLLTLEILRSSAAYSRVMDTKGQKMLTRDFTPQARLSQHAKDVGLILAAGEQTGAQLPLSSVHAELLTALLRAGFGEGDNAAIINAFQQVEPSTNHQSEG